MIRQIDDGCMRAVLPGAKPLLSAACTSPLGSTIYPDFRASMRHLLAADGRKWILKLNERQHQKK